MTDRTATLESLASAWQSDLEVLHYWGYEEQARIVARCYDKLAAQLEGRGHDRVQVGTMLKIWASDADVLEAYDNPAGAAALRRCVGELRSTVSGRDAREDARPTLRRPDVSMPPYRPRSRESAPRGEDGREAEPAASPSIPEEYRP